MQISTREELKDYCLRKLGFPVIEINVDDDQVEDRIQDAIDFWHEYHFDGVELMYLKAQVQASTVQLASASANLFIPGERIVGQTSGAFARIHKVQTTSILELKSVTGTFQNGEIVTGDDSGISQTLAASSAFTLNNWDKEYFEISDAVIGVVRLFVIGPGNAGFNANNIFDVVYQFRLTDMYDLLSTDLIYYSQVKTHLQMMEMLLPAERSIRFNRKSGRLHVDVNWGEVLLPGTFVVAQVYRILDPTEFSKVYNDMFLKRYATALIKRNWGANMAKFDGIQLPGGVTLNGQKLYNEAMEEISKIEEEMISRYSLPVDFFTG